MPNQTSLSRIFVFFSPFLSLSVFFRSLSFFLRLAHSLLTTSLFVLRYCLCFSFHFLKKKRKNILSLTARSASPSDSHRPVCLFPPSEDGLHTEWREKMSPVRGQANMLLSGKERSSDLTVHTYMRAVTVIEVSSAGVHRQRCPLSGSADASKLTTAGSNPPFKL